MILVLFLDETGVEVSNGLIVTLLLLLLLVLVSLLKSSAPYFSIKSLRSKVFLLDVGVPVGVPPIGGVAATESESDSEDRCKLMLGLILLVFLSSFLNK